jgi:hypothetical protein
MSTPARFNCLNWPKCDCPDGSVARNCPGLERITIPPGNQQQRVCDAWPECQCDGDCTDAPRGLTEEQAVLLIVLFALIVSGLGLIYLAVR